MDVFRLSPMISLVSCAAGQVCLRTMQQFVVFDENCCLLPFAYSFVVQVTCINTSMVFYEPDGEGVARTRLVARKIVDFLANILKKRGENKNFH